MNEPIEVTILSSDPILAWAIQARVRDSGLSAHSHTEAEPGAAESAGREPAVVVLAPQTWQELGRWLPGVRRRFGASRSLDSLATGATIGACVPPTSASICTRRPMSFIALYSFRPQSRPGWFPTA